MKRTTATSGGKSTKKGSADYPEPMDPTHVDSASAPTGNQPRVCYALKTLIAEVSALFPETTVETGDVDGRNTALSATFTTDNADFLLLMDVLDLTDPRVESVAVDDQTKSTKVKMRSNPRTQDSREPFGIGEAWLILAGDDESGGSR